MLYFHVTIPIEIIEKLVNTQGQFKNFNTFENRGALKILLTLTKVKALYLPVRDMHRYILTV